MALNFPTSPIPGQVYQAEGATFVWNGALWLVADAASLQFATPAEAIAGLVTDRMMSPYLTALVAPPEGNRIINGAFDIWQRATSGSVVGFAADRWYSAFQSGAVQQARRDIPLGTNLGRNSPMYHLRHGVAGQSGVTAYAIMLQRIENVRSYSGQTITVLGWARRASGAGNITIEGEQAFGLGGSPSANVIGIGSTQVPLTAEWAPFAVVMDVPSVEGKVLGSDGYHFFGLNLWASAGSDYLARADGLGLQTIEVDYWGIHIRQGVHGVEAVEQYVAPEIGPELVRCQRYYCRTIYNNRFTAAGAGHYQEAAINWPQVMRKTPTVVLDTNGAVNGTFNASSPSVWGARSEATSAAAGDCRLLGATLTADAEL